MKFSVFTAGSTPLTWRALLICVLVSIAQAACSAASGNCVGFVSPGGVNHGYGATMGSVYVAAPPNCSWVVSNTNSWITMLSGASGMGTTQVVYSVEPNTGTEPRFGVITFGDAIYHVAQSGHSMVSLPADQIAVLGDAASFSVTVSLAPPYTIQWQFNGMDMVDGAGVSGATTTNVVLLNVQYSQGGNYRAIVSSASGTVPSSSATLTVAPTSGALPLAEALDTEDELFWKTSANARGNWFGQTNTTHDGFDAVECSGLAAGGYANLESKSDGPGLLNFWWKTALSSTSNQLLFSVGKLPMAVVTNSIEWEQRNFFVPTGDMSMRWTFTNSSGGDQSKAWIDQVRFTPCNFHLSPNNTRVWNSTAPSTGTVALIAAADCPWTVVNTNYWISIQSSMANVGSGTVTYAVAANDTLSERSGIVLIAGQEFYVFQINGDVSTTNRTSLAEALDGPLDWTTIGAPEWFGERLISRDGSDAAQSGPIGDGGATTVTTSVDGPGTVLFWWKVSSETNKDYLKFFINGVQQTRISGE